MRKAYVLLAVALAGCTTNPVVPLVKEPVVIEIPEPAAKPKPIRKQLVIPAPKHAEPLVPAPAIGPPPEIPEVVPYLAPSSMPLPQALPSPLIMDPIKVTPK